MNITLPKNISGIEVTGKLGRNSTNFTAAAVLLVLIIALSGWFLVLPKFRAVQAASAQLASLKQQQGQVSSDLSTLNQLVSQMQADPTDIAHLDQAMPLETDTIGLQLLITQIAQSSGLVVGTINFPTAGQQIVSGNTTVLANPYAVSRALQTTQGTIAVSGSFDQLNSFIQKLENSGRLIDINSLEMSAGQNGQLDLLLSVSAYSYE